MLSRFHGHPFLSELALEAGAYTIVFAATMEVVDNAAKDEVEVLPNWNAA